MPRFRKNSSVIGVQREVYATTISTVSNNTAFPPNIHSCCTETATDSNQGGMTDSTQGAATDSDQGGTTESNQDGVTDSNQDGATDSNQGEVTDSDQGGATDKADIASGTVIGSLIVVILAALLAVQLIRMFRKKQHYSNKGKDTTTYTLQTGHSTISLENSTYSQRY